MSDFVSILDLVKNEYLELSYLLQLSKKHIDNLENKLKEFYSLKRTLRHKDNFIKELNYKIDKIFMSFECTHTMWSEIQEQIAKLDNQKAEIEFDEIISFDIDNQYFIYKLNTSEKIGSLNFDPLRELIYIYRI